MKTKGNKWGSHEEKLRMCALAFVNTTVPEDFRELCDKEVVIEIMDIINEEMDEEYVNVLTLTCSQKYKDMISEIRRKAIDKVQQEALIALYSGK